MLVPGFVDRHGVAAALREIAVVLRLQDENAFKVRAYERAADAIETTEEDLDRLTREGALEQIEGVGKAIAAQVSELVTEGTSGLLERLKSELPAGLIEISAVPGLGVKKARQLIDTLGVATLAELEAACVAGRVRGIRGFGARSEQSILEAVRARQAAPSATDARMVLVEALELALPILDRIRALPGVEQAELAGSIRRWEETVGCARFVVATREPHGVLEALAKDPRLARVAIDAAKLEATLPRGLAAEVLTTPGEAFGAAYMFATGSRAHTEKLTALAREGGLLLSARGLVRTTRKNGTRRVVAKDEAAVYKQLGMPFIPPELRDDHGEIEDALSDRLPDDLVCERDIRGIVHCHTTHSDGRNTVLEMARAAEALGMQYITITDHSPAAHYARGVTLDRLKAQWDEIDAAQEQTKIRILRGTECDILEDGALDYPANVLEKFDIVIASLHSRLTMSEAQMTRRVIQAMKQPLFKVWGHALARLVGRRAPVALEVETVLDAVAQSRAAIEVNGDPYRLDLEPKWIRAARDRGIPFVVSNDAHSTAAIKYLPFGVAMARRGGLRRREVLNTLDVHGFTSAVRPTGSGRR